MINFQARNCYSPLACVPFGAAERTHGKFLELCSALGKIYSIDLTPSFEASFACPCSYVGKLKKFCGGLIERSGHEWGNKIRRLSRRQRLSVAASLFLFRKIIPSPGVDLDAYMSKMSTPSPPPDPEFESFCSKEVCKIFPAGWDRNYMRLPERVVLPRSSCTERGMSKGGQRALAAMSLTWLSQQTLIEYCKYGRRSLDLDSSRVVAVETGGKNRIVSTPTITMNVLRPLHTAMYDRLSRFPWLLRGEATAKRFTRAGFLRKKGETFVSGDYESATDNLNHHIQEILLRKVCDQTINVPVGVRDLALSSLSMGLVDAKGERFVVQRRGQLMGNLLSFPLLCLINYIAFKFVVKRNVPLLINGDDIVFRCKPSEAREWAEAVGRSGLTLSAGKTLVDNRFFSLNSKFFDAGDRSARLVPVVRSKGLFGTCDSPVTSIRDRFRVCQEGFNARGKDIITKAFLVSNRRFIIASRRSVRNGLSIPVTRSQLAETGLLFREMAYLDPASVAVGAPRYLPEVFMSDALKPERPYGIEGWKLARVRKTKQVKDWQKEHGRLVISQSWIEPFIGSAGVDDKSLAEELKSIIRDTGYDYSHWIRTMRRRLRLSARMMGLSNNTLWAWIQEKYGFDLPNPNPKPKCPLYYCPESEAQATTTVFKDVHGSLWSPPKDALMRIISPAEEAILREEYDSKIASIRKEVQEKYG